MWRLLPSRSTAELWAGATVCCVCSVFPAKLCWIQKGRPGQQGLMASPTGLCLGPGETVSKRGPLSATDISQAPELCPVKATSMCCPHVLRAGPRSVYQVIWIHCRAQDAGPIPFEGAVWLSRANAAPRSCLSSA